MPLRVPTATARVAATAATRAANATPRTQDDAPSPLGQLGSAIGSGLHYVGTTLNKPSRAVWGTLEGLSSGDWSSGGPLNLLPFSDTLGLTDPDKGVEASQFLENRGVLPENKPGFDWMDIPRLGLDIGGDPLTFTTGLGLGKALGKGGQALKKSGVLDDLTRASGMGPREFLSSRTFRESLKGLPREKLRSVRDAARGMGFSGLSDLSRQAPAPLGGQLGFNLPFGDPLATIGSPGVGRAIDKTLGRVALSPVGREVGRLFNPEARGGYTEAEQRFGKATFRGREAAEHELDAFTQKMVDELTRNFPEWNTPEGWSAFRRFAELGDEGVGFELGFEPSVNKMKAYMKNLLSVAKSNGVDIEELDDVIDFWHRGLVAEAFDDPSTARKGYLRGAREGTEVFREFFKDEELLGMVDSGATKRQVLERAREKYGSEITPDSPLFGDKVLNDLYQQRLEEWNILRAERRAQREYDAPAREFRRKWKHLAKKAQGDVDPASIHPRFDEIVDEYRYVTGRMDATEQDVLDVLKGAPRQKLPPKPKRSDLVEEAAERAEQLRAEAGTATAADDVADEARIPNTYTKLDKHGRPLTDDAGNPLQGDRFKALVSRMFKMTPAERKAGLFRENPVDDFYRWGTSVMRRNEVGKATIEEFSQPQFLRDAMWQEGDKGRPVPLRQVLKDSDRIENSMNLNPKTIARAVLERQGVTPTQKAIKEWLSTPITESSANQFVRMSRFGRAPEEKTAIRKVHEWLLNLWKGGQTSPFPSFHVRNVIAGQVQNMMARLLRPTRALQENKNAYRLINGGTVADAHTIPAVKQMLSERGLEATPENGTQMLRELAATYRVWDPTSSTGWGTDIIGSAAGMDSIDPLDRLMARQPGRTPLFERNPFVEIGSRFTGLSDKTTLNPIKAQMRGGWTGAETSTFGPFAGGELAGAWGEAQNRLPAFLDQLRRGVDPGTAAKNVADAQVEYGSRNFTDAERAIKQFVPFYAFQRRMAEYVTKELLNRPGGPMAQVIKASARASEDDTQGEAAIPLGETDSGSQRFLTGLGLMHESPLGMIGTRDGALSFPETLARFAGSLSPTIKGPLEAVTNQSFFMRGPLGGRELSSMDPAIGGTLANVGEWMGEERPFPARPFLGSPRLEQIAANLPTSRLTTTARTLSDPRKYEGGPFPGSIAAMQLGTGLRFQDISPQQRLRTLENEIQARIRDEGGYSQRLVRFTKRDIEQAEKTDPERAEQMKELNAALTEIRRLRAQLKEQETEEPQRPRVRLRRAG